MVLRFFVMGGGVLQYIHRIYSGFHTFFFFSILILISSQTDVIVNTTSKDDCRSGQISSAILKKAGPNMEQDLRAAFNTTANTIVTKGYNLQCSEVYHTLCTSSSNVKSCEVQYDFYLLHKKSGNIRFFSISVLLV